MKPKVYLAGPISGSDYGSAVNWREFAKTVLADSDISAFSPMRGKAYLSKEDKLQDSYNDWSMSSINGVNVRDFNDVKTANAILVNFLDSQRVSIGTVMEIAWARAFQIPIVIVMERESIHDHGMLIFGTIVVSDLNEGIDAIKQILLP